MSKGIRKIKVSFEDPSLTHFGGMVLFQQFCRKLDIKGILQRHIRWQRRQSSYHSTDLIMTIIYTMVAGMKRFSDTRILHSNGYFQDLLGLEDFPKPSTLREFLKSLTIQELYGIIRVHDLLREKVWRLPGSPTSLIFDLDSTVLPVFGWQIEEAKIGYNPKHKGRPSYHPLVCFEGHTKDCWHGMLRPGNTGATTDIQAFWSACLAKIPRYMYRVRIRADSGFFGHQFIEPLDEKSIGYAIVAKMTQPIKRKIRGHGLRYRTFRKDGPWQAAKFTYQPDNWIKPHRFFVIRRPKPPSKQEQAQLNLWKMRDYCYHVVVSNIPLKPPAVWYYYKKRAGCELDIRELKESLPLGCIPTNSYLANHVHFQLILLAYNLVNWFRRLCLTGKWTSATLYTIRMDLLMLPGRLVHPGQEKNLLKLPPGYIHQKLFYQTLKRIDHLKIP